MIAGKAIAQTVIVAATASERSNDDRDNLAMALLLWLRHRYRKFHERDLFLQGDHSHFLAVSHELIESRSPAIVESHVFVLFA